MRFIYWSSDVCSSDLLQQRALTGQLQRLDDDLVLGAAGIAGEAAGGDHLHAVLGRYAEAPRVAAPADRVEHRIGILQRHVAMARGGALEAGALAAHAQPPDGSPERALPRQGDLRHSELPHVDGASVGMRSESVPGG